MRVEIKIDAQYKELTVQILSDMMSEEVQKLYDKLTNTHPKAIVGIKDERLEILQPESILRFFAQDQKVFAQTKSDTYAVKSRLYELEEMLRGKAFVRISHSEIINLDQVNQLDLSFSGTISISLKGGVNTFVSRRYVSKIKEILGI